MTNGGILNDTIMGLLQRNLWRRLALGSLLICIFAAQGVAKEPRLEGALRIELQADRIYRADDPDAKGSDVFTKSKALLGWYFGSGFSLNTELVFEPVLDRGAGEDRFFGDHGLFAEQLYGQYKFGRTLLLAGKYNPAFGWAWERAPGPYGRQLAQDYQLTERVGFSFAQQLGPTAVGDLSVTAGIFTADRSALSQSLFTQRGRLTSADGGASNTDGLESYAVTLDGQTPFGFGGVGWHLAYRFQKRGRAAEDVDDEHGYVATLYGQHKFDDIGLEWLGEYVYLDNAYASADTARYWTLAAKVIFQERYNVALSFTKLNRDVVGGADLDDHLFQASAGVKTFGDWWMDLGYRHTRLEASDAHTIGLWLTKTIEFSLPNGNGRPLTSP